MKLLFFLLLTSQSVLDVGTRYLQNKDYEKAYQIFQQILTVSKDSPEGKWARYYLGLSLIGLGDTISALGNLITLWKENYDDSLAFLAYKTLTELSRTKNDSLRWSLELVQFYPVFTKRKELIENTLQAVLSDSTRILLKRILASDYKNSKYLYDLGNELLSKEPGKALIISEREGFSLLKIKALINSGKYLQAYLNLLKNNPQKKIPEEGITLLKKTGNSTRLIGILYPLEPENEKTSFEFARILEKVGLSASKFKRNLKEPLYVSYFSQKKLTLADLQKLENLEYSPLRNYILAKGYLKEGYLVKSLQLAFPLPDSFEYNQFKMELVDTFISRGIFTRELLELLDGIRLYYPLLERDERILIISKALKLETKELLERLEIHGYEIKHKISYNTLNIALPDSELIKMLYDNFDFDGVIRFSSGKPLPSSMKYYVASALIQKGSYKEAISLLEGESSKYPTLLLKAMAKLDDPTPYLNSIPKNLSNKDAYYLFVLSMKTQNKSLLDSYDAPYFRFYRAILNSDVDSALKYLDLSDTRMLLELTKLLLAQEKFEKIIELTKDINPLYPIGREIYRTRLKALYGLQNYEELIKEYEKYSDLINDGELSTLAALSALKLNQPDLSFVFALRSDGEDGKKILSQILLHYGSVEEADAKYLEGKNLLYYYFVKKNEQGLLDFSPNDREEAWLKLKYIAQLSGKMAWDSLFQAYSVSYNFTENDRIVLKSYSLLTKNEVDSLIKILNTSSIQDPELLYSTGVKLIQLGKVEEASNFFKSAIDLAEDSLKHEIYFRLGNIEATKGNFSTALFYYTKALNLGAKYSKEIYYNLSISFKNTGQIDSALTYLQKLIDEFPDDEISIEASITLGFQLVERQIDPEKAKNILEKVIGIGTKSQDCEALYWLSRAFMLTQDLKMALATLKRIYSYYKELDDWRDTAKLDAAKILVYFNYREMAKNLYNEIIKARGKNDPLSQEALNQMEFFKL